MSSSKQKSFIKRWADRRQENQGPISVDHNMNCSASNKSKRPRSDKSNEDLASPSVPRSRSSVARPVVPSMTTCLPPVVSQTAKNMPSAISLRQNSQLRNEYYSLFKSMNAPLASPEDMSIENSIQDLANRSSQTSIHRTFLVDNSDRLSKHYQYGSHDKIKIKGTSTKKSLSQSSSQLHRSKGEPISKTRLTSDYRSSRSMDCKVRDEKLKASIRDIPRLSQHPIKATHFPSRDDDVHTTPQKRIHTESVSECSDLTAVSNHFPEKTIASSLESKQDGAKDILESSKSSSQEILFKKTNKFRDFLLSKTVVPRGRCGLRNIGNTCFMNSALQCLSNVPDLTEYILEKDVNNILNTTNDLGTHGNLALAYAKLIKEMWSGKNKIAEGSAVKQHVSELSPRFAGYSQQDSHEFLNVLLDTLHEDLKQDSENTENETSLISQIFHGQIRSTVTCACGEPLITFDSISFLALPIPNLPRISPRQKYSDKSPKRTVTLTDCFNELFKVEILSENGQWFCNKCDCLMDAEKKLDLWNPPKVLILQLKRFTYDILNNVKIQALVEFPFDSSLDLRQFITDPDYKESTLYDLVAISSHIGSLTGGHYTTYAKNFLTNKWLYFNDMIVDEADEKSLQSPNAYILVYRRKEINL
ncbi:unnamed protein product [Rotaria magnacalcarata]|uniref:Ubiquitin carboxyl-terminal hydrolase n=1 Tax=Rotaria magnacalcarata TaxID=392030 RepID=A0A819GYI3_9BILA|nr:unnamed protein product [Rotaria magnacalcarata]CAF3894370.1 unnamed protein product [Rotaria magnacalcarata]